MDSRIKRFLNRKSAISVLGEGVVLTEKQEERLLLVIDYHSSLREWEDFIGTVSWFIKLDLTNYIGRYKRLKKTKSRGLYSCILRYGKYYGKKFHNEFTSKRKTAFKNCQEYWTKKGLTPLEADIEVSKIQNERAALSSAKLSGTSEYTCRSIDYWMRIGMTLDQAKTEVSRI